MLKVVMAKGRRLKKGDGDLEVHKQNVASSKQTIGEENVVPSKLNCFIRTDSCSIIIEN
jgi:hypothetical protein